MAQPHAAPAPAVNDDQVGSPTPAAPANAPKRKPGAAWKELEEHHLPENRIYIVFSGLMMCVFLAALGKLRSSYRATSNSELILL